MHARFGGGRLKKYQSRQLVGFLSYTVHLTESCEAHLPLLITPVQTTSAPVSDDAMTATIHAELERKELLPAEHIVGNLATTLETNTCSTVCKKILLLRSGAMNQDLPPGYEAARLSLRKDSLTATGSLLTRERSEMALR